MRKKENIKERIGKFLRPTKVKIVVLVILFIILELFIFSSRVSVDCFGLDCDYSELEKIRIEQERNSMIFFNIFIVLPVIIISYLILSLISFVFKYLILKIKEK